MPRAETYIGGPCKHGHESGLRYKSTQGCVECAQLASVKRRKRRPKTWRADSDATIDSTTKKAASALDDVNGSNLKGHT